MQIVNEINNKEEWNKALNYLSNEFLQSWEWGEFQKSLGRYIWRLGIKPEANQSTEGLALILKHKLPLGFSYLYSPRGPAGKPELFLEKIKKIALKEKAIFWRIEPANPKQETKWYQKIFSNLGEKIVPVSDVQPSLTTILSLNPSEKEILAGMHYKTRYNIRLAERHKVKIRKSNTSTLKKDIETFLDLLHQTAKRDKFRLWPDNYYRKLIKTLPQEFCNLYLAEEESPLAAYIVIFFKKRATYLYGATSNKKRNLMASYLLHWRIIQDAKQKGYKEYDFWGIDEKKWPGLTRYKKNFGGKTVKYPGTFDVILNKKLYKIYLLLKKIRINFSL